MTTRNEELLREGPREAPEPQTAEERSKLSRAGRFAVGGAAVAAAVVAAARWAIDAAAAQALGEWVVIGLASVLALLIVADAANRFWQALRGSRP